MDESCFEEFNGSKTLAIISPFKEGGNNPGGLSVARYTRLIVSSFPVDQKVVIFCEIKNRKNPYLIGANILVVPTYKLNSITFLADVMAKITKFDAIGDILIQFEFSIFGGKLVVPQILGLLFILKLMGKNTKLVLHQVVTDINTLSGHLAIKKNGLKASLLNSLLRFFYIATGLVVDKVFVHDGVLGKRISKFIDVAKVRIIPHGIEIKSVGVGLSTKKAKSYFGVKQDTKLVGIFGYCSWYKGTDWLIENFARFAKEHKEQKVRLLVAGGESPTLKGTLAYKKYHQKLKKVVKQANGNIVYTGFVPERDVKKVFGAVDLFVFPYRTKMSASGAFSLALGYKKPFIVSKAFSENVNKVRLKGRVFSLNYKSFANVLNKTLNGSFSSVSSGDIHSWQEVSSLYLKESLSGTSIDPKLSYA